MRKLVIDTSVDYLYVGFVNGETVEQETFSLGNNDHSENLIEVISGMLQKTGLEIKDFGAILVGRGPGSYTGVRVSGTVAKVLAYSCNIPLYSFSSLDLLASPILSDDGLYFITINARRGNYFAKIISINKSHITTVMEDDFVEEALFNEKMKAYPEAKVIDARSVSGYDVLKLLSSGLYKEESDVHAYVPNYLRRGV
jgi:tRNA threonylcarbamoyladenosine biosynthesis protein TsaB